MLTGTATRDTGINCRECATVMNSEALVLNLKFSLANRGNKVPGLRANSQLSYMAGSYSLGEDTCYATFTQPIPRYDIKNLLEAPTFGMCL